MGMGFFGFFLPGIYSAFSFWRFMLFAKVGKFPDIVSLNTFSVPPTLPCPAGTQWNECQMIGHSPTVPEALYGISESSFSRAAHVRWFLCSVLTFTGSFFCPLLYAVKLVHRVFFSIHFLGVGVVIGNFRWGPFLKDWLLPVQMNGFHNNHASKIPKYSPAYLQK